MREISEVTFLEWMRARIRLEGTLGAWAQEHDVSTAYVSAVLNGTKPPPQWMLDVYGASREVVYTIPESAASEACWAVAYAAVVKRGATP